MLTQRSKRNMVVVIVIALFVLGIIRAAEASRRTLNLNQVIGEAMVTQRNVEINGRVYNVLTDKANKTITIKGYISDWDEEDQVKRYFDLRGPSNYKVSYQLDFE